MPRIAVDHDYCQAHGRCYARFPELFDADDEGRAVLLGGGAVPENVDPEEIVAVCPESAITLV
ncbi:ferredoxin [Rhodococcus zopfii]|uniref:Ferredoxin n=1 Tax=Rhodococcus zopfii TaxID=43772 RepID=A0ABU3WR96_9NOCA|nr:ferredoxin [Rhodococcus zopfii]MDV2476503.1 ferredoxin [Rhodococcus zopfii]